MVKTKKHIILLLIVLLAAVLRLWQIGNVPISPDWDEAAYGYNAYSMLHTGKDEFGAPFPVVLRSFDDYKPALYLYLVMPFVMLLGVTTEAVRIPSALAGIVTIVMTYLLIRKITKREGLALLTAFLLAISPWHIQFSRIAFEANVGVLVNVSIVYFFLRGLQKPRELLIAAGLAGLNLYVYQSEKVFTPLLVFVLVSVYFKQVLSVPKKYLALAIVTGIAVVMPMLWYLGTNDQALTRARETSIFADKASLEKTSQRLDADTKAHDFIGLVLDNRRVFYTISIVNGYLSHFSLNWLFIEGDANPRHHAPFMGLLYLWELPFLLLGIYAFLFSSIDKRGKWLIMLWFLITPIPASVTSGVPHAVRTINFLPLFQLFTAFGLLGTYQIIEKYKRKGIKYKAVSLFLYTCFILFATANLVYYLNQYFVQQNYYTAKDWQYGYEQAVPYIASQEGKYDKIIVTNKEPLDQSYIFFLYYLQYNPSEYQRLKDQNSSGGFAETHSFGKYSFRPFMFTEEKESGKILYVGRPQDFPDTINPLKTIYYPDGTEAILMVEKQ